MYIFPYLHSTYKNNLSIEKKSIERFKKLYPISSTYLFKILPNLANSNTYVLSTFNCATIFYSFTILFCAPLFFFLRRPPIRNDQEEDIRTIQANVKFVSTLSTGLIEDSARINANIKGHSDRIGYVTGLGIPGEGSLKKERGGEKKKEQKDRD